jgi:hypothetical protein
MDDASTSEEENEQNEVGFKKIEEIPNGKKITGSQYGFPESTIGKRRGCATKTEGEEKKKRKTVSIHSGMFI